MIANLLQGMPVVPLAWRLARWHLRHALGRPAGILGCGMYLTSKCNFKCEFCNIWRIKPAIGFSRDQAFSIVGDLADKGLVYLSFSGGEPLLVPYLFELLKDAKTRGVLYTHVVSNAILMDADKARLLDDAKLSEISFSLDGPKDVHDSRRGVKGAYDGVFAAIDVMRRHAPRIKIVLNTILSPDQPENALHAVEMAARLGVDIKVQPENNHPGFDVENGAAPAARDLTDDQRIALDQALETLLKSPNVANSATFLVNYRRQMRDPRRNVLSGQDCIFGYHHVEFFGGKMYPCLEGLNWKGGFDPDPLPVTETIAGDAYQACLKKLRDCAACRSNYYVCYYEPRLNFPIWNFIGSRLRSKS